MPFLQKNAVSRAQTSAESQTICALGVVPGEPWGDGEAYAVARASRDSNSWWLAPAISLKNAVS